MSADILWVSDRRKIRGRLRVPSSVRISVALVTGTCWVAVLGLSAGWFNASRQLSQGVYAFTLLASVAVFIVGPTEGGQPQPRTVVGRAVAWTITLLGLTVIAYFLAIATAMSGEH